MIDFVFALIHMFLEAFMFKWLLSGELLSAVCDIKEITYYLASEHQLHMLLMVYFRFLLAALSGFALTREEQPLAWISTVSHSSGVLRTT
jgi:hypothetical protein